MNNSSRIKYRDLQETDYDELRELHELLFPVKYSESFFRNVVRGIGPNMKPTMARVAVDTDSSLMAGFVIAQAVDIADCEDEGLFDTSPSEVIYVLTLGTRPEYTRRGIATQLIAHLRGEAATRCGCGAVYLHVIHYNRAAMRFYEHNGFECLRALPQFYKIGDSLHTAYLYISYLDGYDAPLYFQLYRQLRYTNAAHRTVVSYTCRKAVALVLECAGRVLHRRNAGAYRKDLAS